MTAPPLVGASLSQRLMAQRESITAITLVICQSCWAVERISHSHAPSVFTHLPSSSFSFSSSHVNQWPVGDGDMSLLFPSSGLCGVPQGDGTHSRHSPEATVAPRHQRSPGSHRRGREGHPAAWKHSSTLHSVWQYFTICNLAFMHSS